MLFWGHCICWGSFLFCTGSVFLSTPYAWMPICLSQKSVVHLWCHDLEMLSVSLAFCTANTPISRVCFLHYWIFVRQIHCSPVDYSDKWYRPSIFPLMLASTRLVSCWIYSRVYDDLRGHGDHVMWNCTSYKISHASFIFGGMTISYRTAPCMVWIYCELRTSTVS